MKHLMFITTSFPSLHDGSEAAGSFVFDMAATLSKKVKVTVIAPGLEASLEEISPSLKVQRFLAQKQPLSLLKASNPLHWISILQVLRSGELAVNKVVQCDHVDHMLALWVLPSGYWAKKTADRYRIPYSTWALGSDIWSIEKIPIVREILRRVLQNSLVNYADGIQLKKSVEKLSGRECIFLPSTRIIEISKNKVLSGQPPYRLAFLGRWHLNKGVDILLDSLLSLGHDDWKLIKEIKIIGGGPLHDLVLRKAGELKEKGCPITIGGFVNKEKAISLLLWADYVLIPSRIESIPVVFSDALKCSCPVVCTPVGDLTQLVNTFQVGILSKNCSSRSFGEAISESLRTAPCNYIKYLDNSVNIFNINTAAGKLLKGLLDGII